MDQAGAIEAVADLGAISPGRAAAAGGHDDDRLAEKASELFKHSCPIYSCNQPGTYTADVYALTSLTSHIQG